MAKRGDFSFKSGDVERVVARVIAKEKDINKMVEGRVKTAVNMIYAVARQRRPYITKDQMKAEGRAFRVSDPNAAAGVPVAAINGGALQASIQKGTHWEGKKLIGEVYTEQSYAKYLEFGTSKMRARPFMRPAMLLTKEAIKRVIEAREAK